jgi:hypothetical protein
MPMTPNRERTEQSRTRVPIDNKWKEEFVESLLRELRRQLQQLQNAAPTAEPDQAGIRAQNVATLARIERSLDRLMKMQEAQTLKRDITTAASNDNARETLERRLDQLLIAARAQVPAEKSDE